MENLTIDEATKDADMDACFGIRIEVFCAEQKVSREIEFDGLDDRCRHYVARIGGVAVGTARTRPLGDDEIKFERVAVLKPHRGKDIGKALMERAIEDAARAGFGSAVLNAQTYAGPFYAKLGFNRVGEEFDEAGIPHIRMIRSL